MPAFFVLRRLTLPDISAKLDFVKTSALLVTLLIVCIFPDVVIGHPGKTDRHGGHKCLRECEEWKLYYNEYHLHDKDGKPIRIAKKAKKRTATYLVTAPSVTAMQPKTEPPQSIQTVTVYQYVTAPSEEKELFNPLPWILLVLLLLWLIVRMGRKKEKT